MRPERCSFGVVPAVDERPGCVTACCSAAAGPILALALLSPLHPLGERLFTAHMIEHELLMAGAAPLLAVSRPLAALLWGLPPSWRKRLVQLGHTPLLARSWNFLSRPLVATLLHGAAIWLWHVPTLFEAALATGVLHYLQHASFLAAAYCSGGCCCRVPGSSMPMARP